MPAATTPSTVPLALVSAKALPRIHILSDVHLESGDYALPAGLEFDILVAAGDIGPLEKSIPWLASLGKPVVYVLGNHEYYGLEFTEAVGRAKALAAGTQVRVLERGSTTIGGVRFLGATLWSSYGGDFSPALVHEAQRRMSDFSSITAGRWFEVPANMRFFRRCARRLGQSDLEPYRAPGQPRRFHPAIAWQAHLRTLAWLKRELARASAKPTVVVTHHAPCLQALRAARVDEELLRPENYNEAYWHRHYRRDGLVRVAAYASPLEPLLRANNENLLLWAHGHLHAFHDSIVEGVRVVCNPRGRHIPALTQRSAAAYSLLGMRITEEDIALSQAEHARNPYRGDTMAFEPGLIVHLADGLATPAARMLQPHLQSLRELLQSTRSLLPFVFKGAARQREAVLRCIDDDCTRFRDVLSQVHRSVTRHLDPSFEMLALRGIKAPLGEPHLPGPAPFTQAAPQRKDYEALAQLMQDWVDWCLSLPLAPQRNLMNWGLAARRALGFLKDRGIDAVVAAPPLKALRSSGHLPLTLGSLAFVEHGDAHHSDTSLEMQLDTHINGRPPRKWFIRLMPLQEVPQPYRFTLEDLDRILPRHAHAFCPPAATLPVRAHS